jgi:hypothetical protein
MLVALTEQFLDDVTGLPAGLEHKCLDLLSSLRKFDAKDLLQKAPPGWRLHKLKSSPFVSLSLDMSYRVLCKIEGDTVFACRAVKHDLADMPQVNRNANTTLTYRLGDAHLDVGNLYDAVTALGVPNTSAAPLRGIVSEDDLMDALQAMDAQTADLALALYEMSGIAIPRTKFTVVRTDPELEKVLSGASSDWEIYLHPSQNYLAKLPASSRLLVSGSAGTGKTVCAWHRVKELASRGCAVGFACANHHILSVSKDQLSNMLDSSPSDVYFLLPSSANELLQLCESVQHLVIDEGQEFATSWYEELGSYLAKGDTGLTVFYDLNQLGSNFGPGDTKRYEYRLATWNRALATIPNCTHIELAINYRNSREIAEYYYEALSDVLPARINSEVPVFSAGEVIKHRTADQQHVPALISDLILKFQREFAPSDIAVICIGDGARMNDIVALLRSVSIAATTDVDERTGVIVTTPRIFRGHERKAVIVAASSSGLASEKLGRAINSYIALSRARDRLIVISVGR